MKLIFKICLFLVLATFCYQSHAQENEIKGRIIDSISKNPLGFINLRLHHEKDLHVWSLQSKEDGSFHFTKLPGGSYTMKISSVGHQSKDLAVITDPGQVCDLGLIYLSPGSNQLNEVVVKEAKQLIKHEIDRISYDLQADPDSRSSSLLEMIKKVPLLSLDANEDIQMKGNSNFKILIDGRPSSMLERSPKDILRSIPASTIKKIEVITNPPARYDGEGLAGIINIITIKRISNGYSGGLYLSNRYPLGGPAAGGSLGLKAGNFGLSVNSGGSLYHNPITRSNATRQTMGSNPSNLSQQQELEQDSRSAYFGVELSYDLDTLNLITAQFNVNGNSSENKGSQESSFTENDRIIQAYKLHNLAEGDGKGADASVNYQIGFKSDKSKLLTFSYRYYKFNDRSNNEMDISDRVFYTIPSMSQMNLSKSSEQTLQADYVQRVKNIDVEGGIKMISRRNTSSFNYDRIGDFNINPVPQSNLNYFKDKQQILASYGSMYYSSKDWGIKIGARLEQTDVNANFVATQTILNKSYFSLLPSASFKYKINEAGSMTMGYSRRIQRPGIYQLNPFVDRSNPDFEVSGNPEIEPVMYNAMELGFSHTRKLAVFLNLSYMFSKSMIFRISTYDADSRITKTTYQNTGQTTLPGLDYSIKYPLTQRNNITLNGKLAYGIIKRTEDAQELKHSGLMYRYYAAVTHKIKEKWYLSADVLVNGGNLSAQGQSNSFIVSSFKADRTLIKDKLNFSATVSNPFTQYRVNRVEASSPDFMQTNDSRIYFRVFNFSANYRFGKLKDATKVGKRRIKNDDVSGTSSF